MTIEIAASVASSSTCFFIFAFTGMTYWSVRSSSVSSGTNYILFSLNDDLFQNLSPSHVRFFARVPLQSVPYHILDLKVVVIQRFPFMLVDFCKTFPRRDVCPKDEVPVRISHMGSYDQITAFVITAL